MRESLSNAESSSTGLLLKVRRDALRTRASIKPELKKRAVIKQLKYRVTGLDLIEAVSYHEQFIHTFEEEMPCTEFSQCTRGLIDRIFVTDFPSNYGVSYFLYLLRLYI